MSVLALVLLACAARSPEPTTAPDIAVPAATEMPAATETPAAAEPAYPVAYAPLDLAGEPVPFAAWEGQVVLVNLWASWCPPCLAELPALHAARATWGPRGLVLVGVAVDDPPERLARAIAEREIDWPVATDGSVRASQLFDTLELPTTLLYAPDGTVAWKHVGPLEPGDPDLTAALDALLGGGD